MADFASTEPGCSALHRRPGVRKLEQMLQEARETEDRTAQVVSGREGRKTAIEDKAAETKREAVDMMRTYLGEDADALDGFEFLIMAAVPVLQRHFETVREGSLAIAGREDPNETA